MFPSGIADSRWHAAVAAALTIASLVAACPAAAEDFFTERYPAVFFHNMGGFGVHAYTDETLDHLARFDRIFSGNEFALPTAWVDALHQRDGVHRKIFSYEFFPAIHFIFGKTNPQSYDQWRLDFVDDHLTETFTINPVVPGPPPDASPGRWAPGIPLYDYFINYGQGDADDFLIAQYHGKLADWGYDGIFFDLMGSYWTDIGEIEDPAQPGTPLNALSHYGTLGATRDDPLLDYDENGLAFVERLQNEAPGVLEVWGNQAHRSGSPTNPSPYYEVLSHDIDESTFSTWLNTSGWTSGVRVFLDDAWIEDANPAETRIVPYEVGAAAVAAMLDQADQAEATHGNRTEPLILNYVRPYYEPYQDGYRAIVDREAIYYGYAVGKALGVVT